MFKTTIRHAGIACAVAAGAMTLGTTTAEARDRYYRDRGDNDAAIAIGAGILGLAVGAAVASDRRGRYYDDRYYYGRPRGYYRTYPRNYYYRPYPRQRFYGQRFDGWGGAYRGGYDRGGWGPGAYRGGYGWGY
jgi:hypothetical protein